MSHRDPHDPLDALPPLDAAVGPARPLSAARAASLVDHALLEALGEEPPAVATVEPRASTIAPRITSSVRPPAARRRALWLLVAACGLLLAGGALAAGSRVLGLGPFRRAVAQRAPASVATPPSHATPRAAPRAVAMPVAPLAPPPPAPTPATESPAMVAHAGETAARPSARVARADDLLREANALRAQGRWRDAARAYDRTRALDPRSAAAHVAAVAAGDLALDQLGRPADALRAYRGALAVRPSGPLAEEACWGLARAHRALGHRAAEADALRAFVRRFPQSLRRDAADARLREID